MINANTIDFFKKESMKKRFVNQCFSFLVQPLIIWYTEPR